MRAMRFLYAGLFVGSLRSLRCLTVQKITHIVSAVNFEVTRSLGAREVLRLPLADDEGGNLLQHLPASFNFIHAALQQENGKVLIHCQSGVSRSPAVAAAYLMRSGGHTATEALQLIKDKHPAAAPNDGFLAQLGLFQDMKCSLDLEHPVYRLFCHEQVGLAWNESGWVDPDTFAQPPEANSNQGSVMHRCGKCRKLLLAAENIIPVAAAHGHTLFRDHFRRLRSHQQLQPQERPVPIEDESEERSLSSMHHHKRNATSGTKFSGTFAGVQAPSVFVEPMSWMVDAVVGVVQGKLHCPSCNNRLGSFNWAGITNTEGAWVTPAFQLHSSKLDLVEPSRIRMPRIAAVRSTAASPAATAAAAAPPRPSAPVTAQLDALKLSSSSSSSSSTVPAPADASASIPAAPAVSQEPVIAVAVEQDPGSSSSSSSVPAPSPVIVSPPSPFLCPPFTHLILDCDGVMVDTEHASCRSLYLAIQEVTGFEVPHAFPEDFAGVFGMDIRSCIAHYKQVFDRADWVDEARITAEVSVVKERLYNELTSAGISAFDGVTRLIQRAREAGLQVGVGSGGEPAKILHNLTSSGLASLVEPSAIVSASQVPAGKPAPDVYQEVMRRTGCSLPSGSIIVEDAVLGLRAARAAGAFAIGVSNTVSASALEPWADRVVAHLDEIVFTRTS
ncbi:MAG: hypothetical protein WDW36_006142 [Sanguina aurantia]